MSCDKVDASLLQDFLESTIDPLEKIFVENHLKICKECRRELSELKLLLYDLDDKSNYVIDIPTELETMRDDIIDSFLGKRKSPSKKIIEMQIETVKTTGKFIEFLPGAKQAPKILKQASKGLKRGVKKIIAK
ncbi:zf-HC2 domain-containing protein [Ruminiclostridium josui]|uniref:zf-HC2 domain-containing protein n=1 Tax=Ruminiclostridium josui TaxID=1499 RepID=UPI0004678DF1|nr:zf-HC2 domain-containing protein [Ruminiclostridium josui]